MSEEENDNFRDNSSNDIPSAANDNPTSAEGYARPDKINDTNFHNLLSKLNDKQRNFLSHAIDLVRHEEKDLPELSASISSTISVELSELQVVILDEISMISLRQMLWIDRRLQDTLHVNLLFRDKHVLVFGDFLQLPPVHSFFPIERVRYR
ncbi:hypothetical protein BD770DRAFT_439825 [Pilaira anomala]|nr:hypothetical protein BD770DRAFT_439825 [Pilaira anomala]